MPRRSNGHGFSISFILNPKVRDATQEKCLADLAPWNSGNILRVIYSMGQAGMDLKFENE